MQMDGSLLPRKANFVPLTPVDFLKRSVEVFPERVAVVASERTLTYRELGALVGRLAAALRRDGIMPGDVVSVVAGNGPEMLALHFAVPMVGAVLNTINTRLDAGTVAYILDHAGTRLVLADAGAVALVAAACGALNVKKVRFGGRDDGDGFVPLAQYLGDVGAAPITLDGVVEEWQPISLSYTSGTTGRPKGVVYHHRGACLNSLGNALALGFDPRTTYLWVLPMFHCNGWQHAWAVTAVGGRHVFVDHVDPAAILEAIDAQNVTHFSCAPVVLYMLLNHPGASRRDATRRVKVATGGAAPTPTLIAGLDRLGLDPIHMYGLTESYGPATLCEMREEWGNPGAERKAALLARQGARHAFVAAVDVVDEQGQPVPADGTTMGEIVVRSNTLAAGYLKDAAATEAAFAGGVFHTGDLAVRHADGALQIRDRAKDLIISGGENISSLEVEGVLHEHPSVMLAAVVALPDAKWGEIPCACIELRPGVERPSEEELISFCRARLAHFKVPRRVAFVELPKTATGKVQKHALRATLAAD